MTIPPITHPLGEHWRQPKRDAILIDETHALMDENAFHQLAEYSTSIPSGVYAGKMWRKRWKHQVGGWLLCWYADRDETSCDIHHREIIIV